MIVSQSRYDKYPLIFGVYQTFYRIQTERRVMTVYLYYSFIALHLHTHTHPFNGPLSAMTLVSRQN